MDCQLKLHEKRQNLVMRAQIITALRTFFSNGGYDEVHTPVLQVCPSMDAHIHGFKTSYLDVDRREIGALYLHTSPELDMKKLLAAGMERVYQICPVFRNAEGSKLHTAEFTMLEWYRVGEDYTYLMAELERMIKGLCERLDVAELRYQGRICFPFEEWQRLSVVKAFKHYTGLDLETYLEDRDVFAMAAENIDVRVVEGDGWEDIFHAIMAEKIEPHLGLGRATILYDYPISMASLSRKKESDPRFAERFELYICGVELANAFSELTDPVEQRARFDEEMQLKEKLYGESYPADEAFFAALENLPECAGIALGLDRLVMVMCNAADIKDVQWISR